MASQRLSHAGPVRSHHARAGTEAKLKESKRMGKRKHQTLEEEGEAFFASLFEDPFVVGSAIANAGEGVVTFREEPALYNSSSTTVSPGVEERSGDKATTTKDARSESKIYLNIRPGEISKRSAGTTSAASGTHSLQEPEKQQMNKRKDTPSDSGSEHSILGTNKRARPAIEADKAEVSKRPPQHLSGLSPFDGPTTRPPNSVLPTPPQSSSATPSSSSSRSNSSTAHTPRPLGRSDMPSRAEASSTDLIRARPSAPPCNAKAAAIGTASQPPNRIKPVPVTDSRSQLPPTPPASSPVRHDANTSTSEPHTQSTLIGSDVKRAMSSQFSSTSISTPKTGSSSSVPLSERDAIINGA
ncbi:hypothetical protein IAU59_005659 [Kwoniella sp. CBS 9459]